jgi:hypothetical protein
MLLLQEVLSPGLLKAALPSTIDQRFSQALQPLALRAMSDAGKGCFALSADEELSLVQGALLRLDAAQESDIGAVFPPSLRIQLERARKAKLEQAVSEYDGEVQIKGVRLIDAENR